MKKRQYILLLVSINAIFLFNNCSDNDSVNLGEKPIADFSVSANSVIENNTISFTDISTNIPTLWTWQFEGGDPTYSNEKDPIILYKYPGVYAVTLTVRNQAGGGEITKTGLIEVKGKPIVYLSKFDLDGDLTDSGTNNKEAAPSYSNPDFVDGKFGQAWQSPGAFGSYLFIPEFKGIGSTNKRTIMSYFKTSVKESRKTIISYGINASGKMFNIMIDKGKIRVEAGSCSLFSSKSNLDDGEWHHVAITYDPEDGLFLKDMKIYIDGKFDNNDLEASYRADEQTIDTDNSTNDVMIGNAIYSPSGYYFPGLIDDIRILDEVLIEQQIAEIAAGN